MELTETDVTEVSVVFERKKTARHYKQIMPADGWYAAYFLGGDAHETIIPLVGFALVNSTDAVVPLVWDARRGVTEAKNYGTWKGDYASRFTRLYGPEVRPCKFLRPESISSKGIEDPTK